MTFLLENPDKVNTIFEPLNVKYFPIGYDRKRKPLSHYCQLCTETEAGYVRMLQVHSKITYTCVCLGLAVNQFLGYFARLNNYDITSSKP